MHIYIASDHAGFGLKQVLVEFLRGRGDVVVDMGDFSPDPKDDYPDFIVPMAQKVAGEPGSFGIAIGGSGEGEAMAANRVPGVRAVVWYGGSGLEVGVGTLTPALSRRTLTWPLPSEERNCWERGQTIGGSDIIRLSREHNDANVLSIGARFVSEEEAKEAVALWLATSFSGDERHVRRLAELDRFPERSDEFDCWNEVKKKLSVSRSSSVIAPKRGEVWTCLLGKNVGVEINGPATAFSRPILIIKPFNHQMFWGVPLSSKQKPYDFYYNFTDMEGRPVSAILAQMRLLSVRRLGRILHEMPEEDFEEIRVRLAAFIKSEPRTGRGSSAPSAHRRTMDIE